MSYSSSVEAANPTPLPKLHLFWVCEKGKKGINIRTWGKSKKEAYDKVKNIHPEASILWKKEL